MLQSGSGFLAFSLKRIGSPRRRWDAIRDFFAKAERVGEDCQMRAGLRVSILCFFFAGLAAFGQTSIDTPEFHARRKAALEKVPDGIVLLRSSWGLKHWDESGFHQDPSFYYFTGLANAHGAILALDGTKKESWLFISPRIPIGADLQGLDSVFLDAGPQTEKELGMEPGAAWEKFSTFFEQGGEGH